MKIDWTKVKEGFTYQDVLKAENKELKEEIKRLNKITTEFEKWLLGDQMVLYKGPDYESLIRLNETKNKWLELTRIVYRR